MRTNDTCAPFVVYFTTDKLRPASVGAHARRQLISMWEQRDLSHAHFTTDRGGLLASTLTASHDNPSTQSCYEQFISTCTKPVQLAVKVVGIQMYLGVGESL